ncbi:multidrug efflux SMR transporter [Methanohalophilus sp. WG1-DM]|jgi:small multidrug resistance pump|uniref:DMT family transporter n=1 Tax=Methanohalophilus sp. WG1-DM TaxID=2491675 RepID=UPI000FFEA8E4|nr:multidrug efflux SMR transporter [Methanohalophilus sp. WG1-DM]RXG35259.1 small multidrug resistance protein, SMR family [Methanohalophilus sp. WG1-DM]
MSYIYLIGAIIFEVFGTTCMKLSDGFSNILPSVGIFLFYGISFTSLTIALKEIDVSIAYAIWAGMGIVLITSIGIFWFKEPATAVKMISIVFVIIGVVGLNLSNGGH